MRVVGQECGEDTEGEQLQEAEEEDYGKKELGPEATGQVGNTEGQQVRKAEKGSGKMKHRPEASGHGEQKVEDDASIRELCCQSIEHW
jgi:hypothetical protein